MAASLLAGCLATLDFSGISDGRSELRIPPAVAYWPLDEPSGASLAADVAGGNTGVIVQVADSPHFVPDGYRGGALLFPRSDGAVTVASLSQASFPRRGALAMWTRAEALPSDRRLLFAARDGAKQVGANPLELSLERDRFVWSSARSDTSSFVDGVVVGRWFLVVAMWDVGDQKRAIYVREDGGRNSLIEAPLFTTDVDLSDVTFELEHPAGRIDEVRLFDHMLVRAELDAIE